MASELLARRRKCCNTDRVSLLIHTFSASLLFLKANLSSLFLSEYLRQNSSSQPRFKTKFLGEKASPFTSAENRRWENRTSGVSQSFTKFHNAYHLSLTVKPSLSVLCLEYSGCTLYSLPDTSFRFFIDNLLMGFCSP